MEAIDVGKEPNPTSCELANKGHERQWVFIKSSFNVMDL